MGGPLGEVDLLQRRGVARPQSLGGEIDGCHDGRGRAGRRRQLNGQRAGAAAEVRRNVGALVAPEEGERVCNRLRVGSQAHSRPAGRREGGWRRKRPRGEVERRATQIVGMRGHVEGVEVIVEVAVEAHVQVQLVQAVSPEPSRATRARWTRPTTRRSSDRARSGRAERCRWRSSGSASAPAPSASRGSQAAAARAELGRPGGAAAAAWAAASAA
eukprot:scaffold18648_cov124-Isochrysis_galbana.AAC.5